MRCTLAAIALSCLVSPAVADETLTVYHACGMEKALVDEIATKIGAKQVEDTAARGFLAAFNRTTPESHYAGPVIYKDRPKDDSLEFTVRDGTTYCLFGVQGALRGAILSRFEGSAT
ncbi:MAG: hypothetical protein P4L98_06525 [Ancalomicrobiaceae bacterium]|nr:hypothetical protein [Ancalomicrobiaceae bacterium]